MRLRPHRLRRQARDPVPRQPVPRRGRLSLVARRVNNTIPNFEQLGLPPVIAELCELRAGDHHLRGRDRVGQDHQHRLDAPVHQRARADAHRHDRGPDRVHLHRRQVDHQPARDRHRRHGLPQVPEGRRPPGPRHHPGGRDARPGHLQRRPPRRRDRAPRLRDHPRLDRPVDDQPDPRPLPPRDAHAAPAEPGVQPQGRGRPEAPADDQGVRREDRQHAGSRPTRSCGPTRSSAS